MLWMDSILLVWLFKDVVSIAVLVQLLNTALQLITRTVVPSKET